jgi:hypothetical protein
MTRDEVDETMRRKKERLICFECCIEHALSEQEHERVFLFTEVCSNGLPFLALIIGRSDPRITRPLATSVKVKGLVPSAGCCKKGGMTLGKEKVLSHASKRKFVDNICYRFWAVRGKVPDTPRLRWLSICAL